MELRTLVLNSYGQPHQILNWKDAICLVYENERKVVVLEEYDEAVSSPSVTIYVPAVVMLTRKIPQVKKGVKFSRNNVLTRDKFACQYCGTKSAVAKGGLTFDHVLPKSKGGKTNWTNIVMACKPCNSKKGSKMLDESGMELPHLPARPKSLPLHAVFLGKGEIPEPWRKYLNLEKLEAGHLGYFAGDSA